MLPVIWRRWILWLSGMVWRFFVGGEGRCRGRFPHSHMSEKQCRSLRKKEYITITVTMKKIDDIWGNLLGLMIHFILITGLLVCWQECVLMNPPLQLLSLSTLCLLQLLPEGLTQRLQLLLEHQLWSQSILQQVLQLWHISPTCETHTKKQEEKNEGKSDSNT